MLTFTVAREVKDPLTWLYLSLGRRRENVGKANAMIGVDKECNVRESSDGEGRER